MTTLDQNALWRLATDKWAEIGANSPDLAPAVALQQRLLRVMLDAVDSLDGTVSLGVTGAALRAKWERGLPALRDEPIPIPPALGHFLPLFCSALAEGGAGDAALHIRDAIVLKNIDADSLLAVSLSRNQKAIRSSSLHMGFSPDLVWLIGELGSAPLAHRLASSIVDRPWSIVEWDRGYCPVCGSWPAFIEANDSARTLRCSFCAAGWPLGQHRCVYCRNAGDDFVAAAPDPARPQRRVELCGSCGGYTKVIEVAEPTPFPIVAVEDLATMLLDHGAMERGYRRPELFDLDAIEPRNAPC